MGFKNFLANEEKLVHVLFASEKDVVHININPTDKKKSKNHVI